MTAIRKFNKYCEKLANLHKPEWAIPLPDPLPTTLSGLCDGHILMEDVWISRTFEDIPRWLRDPDVREGIKAMLKKERCVEETRRLGLEADNLCCWFGKEYLAVELALATPTSNSFTYIFCSRSTLILNCQMIISEYYFITANSISFIYNLVGSIR